METYKELRARKLADPGIRAEYERLNREEFALLDEMLAARRAAGLTEAELAQRMGTKAPAITRLERSLASRGSMV
ncbi:helix-turn-helix domain-containing protein [Cupriavidus necator]